jgi:hypothetical protein
MPGRWREERSGMKGKALLALMKTLHAKIGKKRRELGKGAQPNKK